jgi:DNA-directed RNA polymerase specialized sigma24 family protein
MSERDDAEGRLTPDLLRLFDPDPVVAEGRLRKLLSDLRRWLEWRACPDPEGVAAESVYRAVRKIAAGAETGKSGLRGFVFGIAKFVLKEGWKAGRREQQMEPADWAAYESGNREQQQIEAGLMLRDIQRLLAREEWEMLLRYYTETDHVAQSQELGVTPGHLRVMIHRVRERLKDKLQVERGGR